MVATCGGTGARSSLGGGSALRILIVGINYEPELAGIGPYTTGLAKHLASEGHVVDVVTGVPHYPQWVRLPHGKGAAEANPRVRRYNHFVPRLPRALGRSLYEVTWLLSALRAVPGANADVVIGVVPSLSGAVVAWLAARRLRAPFLVVFQDLMGAAALQSGYTGARRVARATSRVECSVARRAAGVAIVAEGFRRYLETGGVSPNRIWRVRNWGSGIAPAASREETRRQLGWAPDDFICLHAGNMGQKQALDNLLNAAVELAAERVRIVLAGDGNDRARLVETANLLSLTNVQFLEVQQPGRYEAMLGAADILLLNQRPSVSDMALPSKLSSYFAAGKPVVAAVAPNSEAAHEVEGGGGIVVPPGDPVRLAKTLSALRLEKARQNRLSEEARQYFERYLDEGAALAEFDRVLATISAAEPGKGLPAAVGAQPD